MHSVNTDNSRDTDKVPENGLEPSFVPEPERTVACMYMRSRPRDVNVYRVGQS